ncbi:MAG: ribonuclease HII [Clostridia bacterium]|nr:ribonuclease HII [Clostridia bacterium]MBR4034200.1 ribonuclease HII [Clostridia bacterium]
MTNKTLTYALEKELTDNGYPVVCGVDEAGRGPLCGPVVAAAVVLPEGLMIEGLNDSKKLTEKKREALYDVICREAIAYSIAYGSVEEINELNILEANLLAMRRAIDGLSVKADFALIDGNIARDFQIPARAVVHGDAISPSIAAASILAKVTRDRLCVELDRAYPEYGIAKHKGYGTKAHCEALRRYGPSPIHRTLFVRFLNEPPKEKKSRKKAAGTDRANG